MKRLQYYDFSAGGRGKCASRFAKDTVMAVLDPDVAEVFPDPNSVNSRKIGGRRSVA